LNCHDNQTFAPDVMAANNNPSVNRLAGALNTAATAGLGYPAATGHTLGITDAAPGATTWTNSDGLDCIDCHTQHGRTVGTPAQSVYRNLNIFISSSSPSPYMTYAIATNDLTKDVFERSASYGGTHYDLTNVDFNEPVVTASAYGQFCGQCHANFHGTSTSTNMRDQTAAAGAGWLRHPTADANIGGTTVGGNSSIPRAWGLRNNRVKVMSPTGNWGTQGTAFGSTGPTDLTPSCMSCHRAHGTTNAFGLIYPDETGANPILENGATGGTYKGICKQCHVQG
jgi:hypothetical protein